jgi:hypothetical protein
MLCTAATVISEVSHAENNRDRYHWIGSRTMRIARANEGIDPAGEDASLRRLAAAYGCVTPRRMA